MDERQVFTELLQDMLEQAEVNGNRISQAEIQEYFEDLNLSEEQMNHIYAYLVAHRITVQGFVPGAESEKKSRLYETFGHLREAGQRQQDTGSKEEISKTKASGMYSKESSAKSGQKSTESLKKTDKPEADSSLLKLYLRELQATEKLTKAKERELAERILGLAAADKKRMEEKLSGKIEASFEEQEELKELKERFIHHKLRYVVEQARAYADGGELLDELIQEGNMGLLAVMQQLEQHREAEAFLTYVEAQVIGAMEAYLSEAYASDGEEQAMVAKVHFVSEAAKAMKEENGQEPTVSELAAYTNLTEEELLAIINLSADNLKA